MLLARDAKTKKPFAGQGLCMHADKVGGTLYSATTHISCRKTLPPRFGSRYIAAFARPGNSATFQQIKTSTRRNPFKGSRGANTRHHAGQTVAEA